MSEDWSQGRHAVVRHVMRDPGNIQMVAERVCPHLHRTEATASRCANRMMRKWKSELNNRR